MLLDEMDGRIYRSWQESRLREYEERNRKERWSRMLTVSRSKGVLLWVIRTNKSLMSLSFLKDQADVRHGVVAERVRDTKKSDRRETS